MNWPLFVAVLLIVAFILALIASAQAKWTSVLAWSAVVGFGALAVYYLVHL